MFPRLTQTFPTNVTGPQIMPRQLPSASQIHITLFHVLTVLCNKTQISKLQKGITDIDLHFCQ